MSNLPAKSASTAVAKTTDEVEEMYVTMTTGGQLFGIRVLQVQDVLGPQRITRVPLAPPEVAGSLNLRGRIVTAVDVRIRLGLEPRKPEDKGMNVVVSCNGELFSLVVDKVGEVMGLSGADFEKNLGTLDPCWLGVANGIYRLKDNLLVVLDVARLLRVEQNAAA